MESVIQVLLIGALSVDDMLIRNELAHSRYRYKFHQVSALTELDEALDTEAWQLAFVGLDDGFDRGVELISALKGSYPHIPVVAISSESGEERVITAMKAGADDYILKEHAEKILPVAEQLLDRAMTQEASRPQDSVDKSVVEYLARSVRDILYNYNAETGRVWVQDSFGMVFPEGETELPAHDIWNDRVHTNDQRRIETAWDELHSGADTLWHERYKMQSEMGKYIPIEDKGYCLRDEKGNVERIVGVMIPGGTSQEIDEFEEDIQESRDDGADEEHDSGNDVLQWITNAHPDIVIVTDASGNLLYATGNVLEEMGIPATSFMGDLHYQQIHPDERDVVLAAFDRHLDSDDYESRQTYRLLVREHYRTFEANIRSFRTEQGRRLVICATRNVSGSGLNRMDGQSVWFSFIELLEECVFLCDADGAILAANSSAAHALNSTATTEFTGKRIQDVLFGPWNCNALFERLARQESFANEPISDADDEKKYVISAGWIDGRDGGRILQCVLRREQTVSDASTQRVTGEYTLREYIARTNALVILVTPQGVIREWNGAAGTLFGIPRNDALGMNFLHQFLAPEEMDRVALQLARISKGYPATEFSCEIKDTGAKQYIVRWNAFLLKNEEPQSDIIMLTGTDITDHARVEAQRLKKAETLNGMFDAIPNPIWIIDSDSRIQLFNPACARFMYSMYGLRIESQYDLLQAIPEEDRRFWTMQYERAFRNENFTFRWEPAGNKQKKTYEVACRPIGKKGNVTGAGISLQDITERVALEIEQGASFRRSHFCASVAGAYIPMSIEVFDTSVHNILVQCAQYNSAKAAFIVDMRNDVRLPKIVHYKTEECEDRIRTLYTDVTLPDAVHRGKEVYDGVYDIRPAMFPVNERALRDIFERCRGMRAYVFESPETESGYIHIWYFFGGDTTELAQQDLEVVQTTGTMVARMYQWRYVFETLVAERDRLSDTVVSQRDSLNEVQCEQMQTKEWSKTILAFVENRVQYPVTAILGLTEYLEEQAGNALPEKQKHALQQISTIGRTMLSYLHDLMSIAQVEMGKISLHEENQEIDLLCKSSLLYVRKSATRKNVTIQYRNTDPTLCVYLDGVRFKQVVIRVLEYIVQKSEAGSNVSFTVKPWYNRKEFEIEIRTSGFYLKDENLSKIFKPHVLDTTTYSEGEEGSGAGLTLAAAYTEIMGGAISVESTRLLGMKFSVVFPLQIAGNDEYKEGEEAQDESEREHSSAS